MDGHTPREDGRYYVVLEDEHGDPYVVAETARELSDTGSERELSLAGTLAGAASRIMTESEMDAMSGGASALSSWRERDDRTFDSENLDLGSADDPAENRRSVMRLVPASTTPVRTTARRTALALVT